MFELPEYITLARQMNETLAGKIVKKGSLGNVPHRFVWYNTTHAEFEKRTAGKQVGHARAKGKWLFLPLQPGYVMLLGECGGKVLYHSPGSQTPARYHLCLTFQDGSALSVTTQMWGAMELYEQGKEQERKYIKDMRPTPIEPEFTFDYLSSLVDSLLEGEKRSAKGLLTQEQLIPGLGNAIAQDILFRAGLHPKHPIADLKKTDRRKLYHAICKTVRDSIDKCGRYDEYDLYDRPGNYVRIMDAKAVGRPCPKCGSKIAKLQYLGGACYLCPRCQI